MNVKKSLLDYMDSILKQGVFSDLEQKKYVQMMAQTGERLYEKDASKLTQRRYEGICLRFWKSKSMQIRKSGVCVWHSSTRMSFAPIRAG